MRGSAEFVWLHPPQGCAEKERKLFMSEIKVVPYIPDEDYDNPAMVVDFYERGGNVYSPDKKSDRSGTAYDIAGIVLII